jgi:hypothetical protein
MTRARDVADTQDNLGGAVPPFTAGKNVLINSDFKISQRNTGLTTTSTIFVVDRFSLNYTGGTCSGEQKTFSPGAGITGLAGVENYLEYISSGQSATTDFMRCRNAFEDVYTFAGETVTFSFYAKAATGTPKIALGFSQNFGTGGSTGVTTKAGDVTISSSWARYSITFTMPSISGKTIGANHFNTVQFFMSAGTGVDSGIWGIGVQNNTFQFTALQLEAGSVATPFQTATGNPQSELVVCQRYYQRIASSTPLMVGHNRSTTECDFAFPLKVTMRTTPSQAYTIGSAVLQVGTSNVNITGLAQQDPPNVDIGTARATVASGLTAGQVSMLYGVSTIIQISAEL